MNRAHIIICNDSVEHVVIGSVDEAWKKLAELKEDYYATYMASIGREAYELRCPWGLRTVDLSYLPGTIPRAETTKLRMVAGNERKFGRVICDGIVREWVGIGWIGEWLPTEYETMTLPRVV